MYIHLIRNLSKIIIFVFTINVSSYAQEPYHWQLSDEEGLPSMTIYKVIQDKKGLIWIATANGLCSFDGKNVINYNSSILNDQEILKIQEGTDGNIWGMNLSGQLFYLKNNEFFIFDKAFYSNSQKNIDSEWLNNSLINSNKLNDIEVKNNKNHNTSNSVCFEINGNKNELFLIHQKGFSILNSSGQFEYKSLFSNYAINDILRDKEQNIWLATDNSGLMIIPNLKNIVYNKQNSILKSDAIYTLSKVGDNALFIGIKGNTINVLKNNKIEEIPIKYDGRVLAIAASEKIIWIGGDNGIIYSSLDKINFKKTNVLDPTKALFLSSKNFIYFGTNVAFGELNQKNEREYENTTPLRTYAINESIDGTIWIGSSKGLFYKKGNEIQQFTDERTKNIRVTNIACDKSGKVWVSTQSQGVFCIANNQIIPLPTKLILPTNNISCIFLQDDYIWFGSDKGVFRYHFYSEELLYINRFNGLPSDEILSLSILQDDFFIGTANGLVKIPINEIKPKQLYPEVFLKGIAINETAISDLSNNYFNLPYNKNNILINFQSYQFRSLGKIKYEYKISNLDTSWITTEENFLRLSNLKPSTYHITIRTINENNLRSNQNIELYFNIAKPFWQQYWFYALFILISSVLIYEFYSQKYKSQLKFESLKMHAVQSQMNPHFIFNALNSIQHFLVSNDADNAIRFLSKFARFIRLVFEYTKRTEISLQEEIEMLNIYLSLEKMRFKDKIEINLTVSENLNNKLSEFFLPPLLIQPIVERAFKYGLFHKLEKGNIWIDFDITNEKFIKCVVKDDGIGRNHQPDTFNKKAIKNIQTIEERLKHHHKINETKIKDCIFIEDILPNGTKFTMII